MQLGDTFAAGTANVMAPETRGAAETTWVSVLTPAKIAAVAVIGLCGPDALAIVSRYCRLKQSQSMSRLAEGADHTSNPNHPLGAEPVGYARLSWFDDGQQRDQVLVVVRRVTPSYLVEIHCHGGPAVIEWIVERLRQAGAHYISNDEWWKIAETDAVRSAAFRVLCRTSTTRTAAIVLDQLQGAWIHGINKLAYALESDRNLARQLIERLAELIPVGQHLGQPFRVAIAGAPNAGKSTLLNALLGYSRAITSPQPGTTRDKVTAEIAFEGWPILLIDTAGWRATDDPLELAGISQAQETWQNADLVLWVLDIAAEPVLPPESLARCFYVVNKVDLPAQWSPDAILPTPQDYVCISAKTGLGMESLVHRIATVLVPNPPQLNEPVPFTESLCEQVLRLREAIHKENWTLAKDYLGRLLSPEPVFD